MRSTATSTSVTRSIVPFLSIWKLVPNFAICMSPARTTASMAVVSHNGLCDRLGFLDHADFHPALRRALQLHVVHEVADEENTAAAGFQEVVGVERVGDQVGVEALALIPDANRELRHVG